MRIYAFPKPDDTQQMITEDHALPWKPEKPELILDPLYPRTIVIPTIGTPDVVAPMFKSLRSNLPSGTRVIVVINPKNVAHGTETADLIERLGVPDGCALDVLVYPGPIGFGGANNAGIAYAAATGGVGEIIVSFNDDLRATPGWLESLEAALASDVIQFGGEFPDKVKGRPPRTRSTWGEVGMVGPVTTVAAGVQGAVHGDEVERLRSLGHAEFSRSWRARAGDQYLSASFLSGFCVALSRRCAQALLIPCPIAGYGVFDSAQYPIAGYEDNDICLRAQRAGFRLAVDWANYVGHVGHQSFDAAFPHMQRGMANRAAYYGKYEPDTQRIGQRLVGVYRVKIGSVQDLVLFQASLSRHAAILDGVAVLLTNNPARDMPTYPDWNNRTGLKQPEAMLLKAIAPSVKEGTDWKAVDDLALLQRMFSAWVRGTLLQAGPGTRFRSGDDPTTARMPVIVDIWAQPFNEREERNAVIAAGYTLDPDWLISIDHDEVIEDRIRRGHFERWMMHPDPLVSQYDFGWMDHWNDTQHFRTDPPWGDGGRFTGGRHGRRMWRAIPALRSGERIQAGTPEGLHCGNIPDAGVTSARITGARWRHFGYVRQMDRHQRYQRYSALDPNPDPKLMGGSTYGHIVSAEGMRIEFYGSHNGIAMHMLCYAGEDPGRIADKLDHYYALVDHLVLVWTDDAPPDAPAAEGGMSEELKGYCRLFKVDVLHAKLRDENGVNFSAVRNAAIEHIETVNRDNDLGLGWGLIMDPDESFEDDPILAGITLRRMAESTETHGWIVRFKNPTIDGNVSGSDSVRLHRLTSEMRMRGRVHESFDDSLREASRRNGRPALRVAPIHGFNPGLANPDTIGRKIRGYAEGLIAELRDSPDNGGAWASLGLQFEAEGRHDEAVICYRRACQTLPDSYLGWRAMMSHHLRTALAFAAETQSRLSPAHGYRPVLDRIIEFLEEVAPAPTNPAGQLVLEDLALPPMPEPEPEPNTGELLKGIPGVVAAEQPSAK